MSTFLKILAGKGKKMKNVRVHFKKWEPVGEMEGYNSKMGTTEEYNSKTGADIKMHSCSSKNWRGSKIAQIGGK